MAVRKPEKEKGNSMGETYIRPAAATRKLRAAWKARNAAYLYGVTGIGKTALVRSFLEGKKYTYYSANEVQPSHIEVKQGGIVVVDDLHAFRRPEDQEACAERIQELLRQRNVWLVLISRSPVPKWLFPLHAEYAFTTISEQDFYLSREEQALFLDRWAIQLSEDDEERAWQLAKGHPLSLRLLAIEKGDIDRAMASLWNYLETHVYDQWDVELQEFIMETSIVDRFTKSLAAMITGKSNVGELLSKEEELGNFLVRTGQDDLWEYRWALRQSMRRRLDRLYSREKIWQLYWRAGLYYELHDQILDALEMYQACEDQESISRLLTSNARKHPGDGHFYQLRKYYLALPEEMILKSPVLIACMSMIQSTLMNAEESERWYRALEEYARNSTGSARREAKARLLYLDIGLPHRGSVNLADMLKNAGVLLMEGKAILPELSVTSNLPSLMNGGKDFCEWSKRDRELASGIGRFVELALGKFGKGLVPLALAESYLEKGSEDSYEIMCLAEKGRMRAEGGGKPEMCFVSASILAWLSAFNGKADQAEERLISFRSRAEREAPRLLPNLDALLCRMRLYQGKRADTMAWMEQAPDEQMEFCTLDRFRYLTKARIYLQSGRLHDACGLLEMLLYYAEQMDRPYIQMEATLLLAIAQHRLGMQSWLETLQRCVAKAEEYHFVRLLTREGAAVWPLLNARELQWSDDSFRMQVLAECEQMASDYPRYLKHGADEEVVLSENALKILRLQAEGVYAKEIAEKLGIKETTVKYHCRETYRKLGVSTRIEAVNEARRRKLI